MANLLTNPGAETNTTGWAASGASTLGRSTSTFRTGVASFTLDAGSAGGEIGMRLAAEITGLTAGTTATVNSYLRSRDLAGQQGTVRVEWRSSSGVVSTTSLPAVTLAHGAWTQVAGSLTVPSGADRAVVIPTVLATTNGQRYYLDDLLFEAAATETTPTRPPTVLLIGEAATIWPDEVRMSATGTDYTSLSTALTTRPAGSASVILDASTTTPGFLPDKVGTYALTTTATGGGGTATSVRSVEVRAQMWVKTATGTSVPLAWLVK